MKKYEINEEQATLILNTLLEIPVAQKYTLKATDAIRLVMSNQEIKEEKKK